MPDWTYHPFFKPLLFRMPAEEARALTLQLLAIQARTSVGRRIFRLFGHGPPPPSVAVKAFGLNFPAPIGLAAGIDTAGTTLSVMQHLGFGFLQVGPVGAAAAARRAATDPLRIIERHALIGSTHAAGPAAAAIAARIQATPELTIPIGVALRGARLADALREASGGASFFTLPSRCADEPGLASLRAATDRPLLLQLSPSWSEDELDRALDRALEARFDGCVAVGRVACPVLPDGEMDGPFLRERALSVVAHVARRHGDALPIIAAGGIMTPEDALAMLDAGARLVELYTGLVFAGPGLPGRILHAIERRPAGARISAENAVSPRIVDKTSITEPSEALVGAADTIVAATTVTAVAEPTKSEATAPAKGRDLLAAIGSKLLVASGLVLIVSGIFAIVLAATVQLLPFDVRFLGMTVAELCDRNACRIVHFMAHDRVSFGGSIISIGILYTWLAGSPLRRGEAWAWWTFVISGVIGFGSFLTYLGYGYLDEWHGMATMALLPVFVLGLVLSHLGLRGPGPRGPAALLRPGARAWLWSPAGRGRIAVTFTAMGMILGGLTIMTVGMTSVFVPTDLEFMQVTRADLDGWNPRLVSLIAHDRAGFGGGLCSGGLTVLLSLWCGARPRAWGLWIALLLAGSVGFATAIGIHPIVGYTSFVHLAPAYAGAIAFVIGMALLFRPMCRVDAEADRFPDI